MRTCFVRRRPIALVLLALLVGVFAAELPPVPRAAAFSNGQAAALVLGQGTFTSSSDVTPDHFFLPTGIALDPTSGAVFVADTEHHRVLRFGALASLTDGAAAEGVLGQSDLRSSTAATTAQGMNGPGGLAVDREGRLWVADSWNHRVLRFDAAASKSNGAPADGLLGQPDFTSNEPMVTAQGMDGPLAVAVDGSGHLWVAEFFNHRVLRFDAAAGLPAGAPAATVLGQPNFTSRLPRDPDTATMDRPRGLAVDGEGRLWVADRGNHRVLRFDAAAAKPTGAPADGVLGQPSFETGNSTYFGAPYGLAVDESGRLWVADSWNERVLRFDAAASLPMGAEANGGFGAGFPDVPTANNMAMPAGLAVDRSGRLWAVDSGQNRVLRFDAAATKPDGAPADGLLGHSSFTVRLSRSAFTFAAPVAVAVDPTSGKVFVADRDNNRVLRFGMLASLTNGAPAERVLGQPDLSDSTGASSAQGMQSPTSVAVDGEGRLWVADSGNNRVLRFDGAASLPSGAPANGILGHLGSAASADSMQAPLGVSVDGEGRLWVADSGNNRVLRFDAAANLPNYAPATGVLGQPNFTTAAAATTAEGMRAPPKVAVDREGRLWVADSGNNRVLRFDTAASQPNGAPAAGVLGQPDFTSHSAACEGRLFCTPDGVAVDGKGQLWVADSGFNRVLRFDVAASKPNGSAADGVLGQANFTSSNPSNTVWGMSSPAGLAVDREGRLWVADKGNKRVLMFESTQRNYLPRVTR